VIAVSVIQLILAVSAICLSPIYVFSSGNPQPTDMVWSLFVLSMLLLSPGAIFQHCSEQFASIREAYRRIDLKDRGGQFSVLRRHEPCASLPCNPDLQCLFNEEMAPLKRFEPAESPVPP